MLFVEAGQIGTAATERDAERSAGNNHREGKEAARGNARSAQYTSSWRASRLGQRVMIG
jgi:hypothetical protein